MCPCASCPKACKIALGEILSTKIQVGCGWLSENKTIRVIWRGDEGDMWSHLHYHKRSPIARGIGILLSSSLGLLISYWQALVHLPVGVSASVGFSPWNLPLLAASPHLSHLFWSEASSLPNQSHRPVIQYLQSSGWTPGLLFCCMSKSHWTSFIYDTKTGRNFQCPQSHNLWHFSAKKRLNWC